MSSGQTFAIVCSEKAERVIKKLGFDEAEAGTFVDPITFPPWSAVSSSFPSQSPRVSVSLNFATFVAIAAEKGAAAFMLTGIFACGDTPGGVLLSLPDRGPNPSLAYTAASTRPPPTFATASPTCCLDLPPRG